MPSLVTRFHLLLFGVTLAIAGVALIHIPPGFAFPAHWQGSAPDWLWPRDVALAVPPLLQLTLMAVFFFLGLALTSGHLARTRHILEPALTLLLSVAAACQLGLLLIGIGSDFDMFRIAGAGLALVLLVVGVVVFEAERHSYGGLRMPWPIPSDRAWLWVHRISGSAAVAASVGLGWLAWTDPGPGVLVLAMTGVLAGLPLLAGVATLATRRL